jgi:cytochrome o ubiquinol oxidase operon protein cyoD
MSSKSEEGWTLVSLIFTLVLVVITLAGSLWVMYHLNSNMMPGHETSVLPSEPF